MSGSFEVRPGCAADAVTVAALATQVFLDTYATQGIRPDLAREAFLEYSEHAFVTRFFESQRRFIVAMDGDALVGFHPVSAMRCMAHRVGRQHRRTRVLPPNGLR